MNSIALCADYMPAAVLKSVKFGALNSHQTITTYVEPSLAQAKAEDKFQFGWHVYFVVDRVEDKYGKVVSKKIMGLKDACAK